jgi:hypothetical protein
MKRSEQASPPQYPHFAPPPVDHRARELSREEQRRPRESTTRQPLRTERIDECVVRRLLVKLWESSRKFNGLDSPKRASKSFRPDSRQQMPVQQFRRFAPHVDTGPSAFTRPLLDSFSQIRPRLREQECHKCREENRHGTNR